MSLGTEPAGLHSDARTYLATGTEAQGRRWLGREVVREAPLAVNRPEIGRFCAMVEDPDENHWDEAAARRRYGAIISPPGMFMVWAFPLPWRPEGRPEHAPLLALEVPLPGGTLINVATTTTFIAPMREGDRLRFHERLTDLSPPKTTPLGTGHFLTTVTDGYRWDGTQVGTHENVLFRYQPSLPGSGQEEADPPGPPEELEGMGAVPEVVLALTRTRVGAMIPMGTRDLFPGHHDPDYAAAQGAADIYLNTMFLHGVVDRAGKAWAGPDAWLRRRTLRMHRPAYVGSELRTRGTVAGTELDGGRRVAELFVEVLAGERLAATATLTFDLDGYRGSAP